MPGGSFFHLATGNGRGPGTADDIGMLCSVVIPCHNGADLTHACVESLLAQDGPRPHEILLVDNASTDGTAALVRAHPSVRVLRQPTNLGFGAGVNVGIRQSRGELVLVLNNDTLAAPNLLQELTAVLQSSPTIGAAAPVSNHVKGPARVAIGTHGRDPDDRAELARLLQGAAARMQDVDTLAGLCLLIRRSTLDRVGVFDERFGHGNFEDDDLCLRLRLHGYRLVIARRAFLHHEGHATFRALGLDVRTEIDRRRQQFLAKWRPDPAGRATIAALQSDLGAAATAAAAARRIWPLWPEADWHLARWHTANGNHATAARHLRQLLCACPHHSEAAVALGAALRLAGDAEAAHAQLMHAARTCHLAPDRLSSILGMLGEHDYARGRIGAAVAHFRSAVEMAPADGGLHNWLGVGRLASGDLHGAEQSFRAGAAADFALAHTNLGICLQRQDRIDEARVCFERAVELLPDDPTARRNLLAAQGSKAAKLVSSRDS